ncbi:hypothetical protein BRARA_D01535 [Brassica rapa]|uniref:Uncharacterized protein n=2 Tax=Brassica TaxID=3705 RepID=A0ABQ8DKD0_BRANA|nr:uncharacterized protein LOC106446693 isoform X2 [Brassica napus]KAH0929814.1 hypothetical protein HID58_015541 [Brassica napus]RID66391.1 hypothetical protein BRARA_D01535 [Brassica rapa]
MKKPTPTAVTQDEWVTAALTEDAVVVELLLRLKHAGTVESAANIPLLRWGSRKPRSRLGVGGVLKKETDSARASPMTPLCWSGGSGSGGSSCPSADGFEDASRQSTCSTSTGYGSKALHVTNEISSYKRSKKQKIFLDLKDAENFQLKERLNLQKNIANVQATYKKRSAKNQSLKRMKLEYSDRIKNISVNRSNLDETRRKRRLPFSSSGKVVKKEHSYRTTSETKRSEEKGFFFLPDLNMTPIEEEETLYGTR